MSGRPGERGRPSVPPATWALLAMPPVAWALFTGLAWVLPDPVCESGASYAPHLAAGAALAVALGGVAGAAATLARRRDEPGEAASLTRFVATVGVLVGALLVVGLAVAWAYMASHDACW